MICTIEGSITEQGCALLAQETRWSRRKVHHHQRHRTAISIKINIPPKQPREKPNVIKWAEFMAAENIKKHSRNSLCAFSLPWIQFNRIQFHFSDLINKAPVPARERKTHSLIPWNYYANIKTTRNYSSSARCSLLFKKPLKHIKNSIEEFLNSKAVLLVSPHNKADSKWAIACPCEFKCANLQLVGSEELIKTHDKHQ